MNIRKAKQEDLPVLVSIYNQAILNTTATFDFTPVSIEDRQSWFDEHKGRFPLIVAEEGNIVMGYASLSRYHSKEAYNRTVEISIYIDERHQGKGVGKQLLAHIIELGKTLGYHVIIACITKGNNTSVKLHEQYGFIKCGEMREVGFKFNSWQDVLYYQLIL
ncbi:GNAT family N-acetyltransferase [Bacillus songklensis]|uniref:GNAT family N-acetyltransferase n=1 Tax=Bacillus songklensis TaxID=1069116 RepID=A0ABV8B930_9BACI